MSKKILTTLLVVALVAFVSNVVMAANVKTVGTKDGAILYSAANDWSVYVPEAGTVFVKDNKVSYEYDFDAEGTYFIGLQKGYTGQLSLVGFVPNPVHVQPVTIRLGFIGWYGENPNTGLPMQTSFYWQELQVGDMIDWDAVDAAYDAWVAQGGIAPDRTFWRTSGALSFTFEDYAAIGFDAFDEGQLEAFYKNYYVDSGYVLPPVAPTTVTVTFVNPSDRETIWTWGDVEIGTAFTWDTSLYAYEDAGYDFYHRGATPDHIWDLWVDVNNGDLYTYAGSSLVYNGVNTETGEWGSWYAGQEEWIPIKTTFTESVTLTIIMLDTPTFGTRMGEGDADDIEDEDAVFASAEVTSFNTNLQNANNGNLKFTVTVTLSDGSTYDVDHAENVNGGEKGNKTFVYGDYSVKAVWNDNNKVTSVTVL